MKSWTELIMSVERIGIHLDSLVPLRWAVPLRSSCRGWVSPATTTPLPVFSPKDPFGGQVGKEIKQQCQKQFGLSVFSLKQLLLARLAFGTYCVGNVTFPLSQKSNLNQNLPLRSQRRRSFDRRPLRHPRIPGDSTRRRGRPFPPDLSHKVCLFSGPGGSAQKVQIKLQLYSCPLRGPVTLLAACK